MRVTGLLIGVGSLLVVGPAAAQPARLIRWTFNDGTLLPDINLTGGTPQIVILGGLAQTFAAQTGGNGANASDPAAGQALALTGYPAAGGGSGTAGVRFGLPTTGFDDLVFRFDQRNSNTSSRFYNLEYTLNGTDFILFERYASNAADGFFTHTIDLSGLAAANNNPNFAVRMVSVFDPATGDYSATNGTSAYDPAGTVRYDAVTLSRAAVWAAGTDLTTPANFTRTVAPGADDTVLFGASAGTAIGVPASATYGQFVFRANAPAYIVSVAAGQTLTLNAGIANRSSSRQTFNGAVAFPQAATVQSDGVTVFNGPITVGGGGGLQISGTGTTVINNTYTGNDISLSTGRTLAGIGTIQNEIHMYGGTIRGGFADGTNDLGTLTIAPPGGSGDLELYAAPGNRAPTFQVAAARTGPNAANNSLIALVGGGSTDLELNDAGVGANLLRFQLLAPTLQLGETYALTILTTDSTGSIEFNNTGQADGFVFPGTSYELVSPDFPGFSNVEIRVANTPNSTLVLTFTPVPEPTTVLGVAAAGLVGLRRLRRVIG